MTRGAPKTSVKRKSSKGTSRDDFVDAVRFSRDGDQFHYLWAARRLLKMLDPHAALVAVAIEGVSRLEADDPTASQAGEAVVDLAEYDGDERFETASQVRYLQLKHSTQRADLPWDAAGLAGTLTGFAERYEAQRRAHGQQVADKLRFDFVTNRPIAPGVAESVEDLATGARLRHPRTARALAGYVTLGAKPSDFWRAVRLRGNEGNRGAQQVELLVDVGSYLPGPDINAPLQLKELVVQRLLPEHASDPVVRRMDVLRALGVSPDEIFPAPNRIEVSADAIPRAQETEIARAIVSAPAPTIIEAPSGVGKSVLSTRLGALMPPGSATVVYDCFGAGDYRQRAHPRHRPKDALVQIGNELAALGLSDPLLPGQTADATAYFRALFHRIAQSVATLRRAEPEALLVLVIDAADNAEMGALEAGDQRSFVKDLLRSELPEGARLVMLCRPERRHLLNPPPSARRVTLRPFTLAETKAHLRRKHPGATEADAREFHHRTSHNPRVQANALALDVELAELLRGLGPDPKSVDDTIAAQLQKAVEEALDAFGQAERPQVEALCAALAMLRPLIPVDVLAAVSGLTADAIRSFAVDFVGGRPIMVVGDAVQFRDEPVEDWFRKTYRADAGQLGTFVDRLKPLATTSAYVAAALPAMLLEAGALDELIRMALSASHLPTGNALQRRDVELQRLQFALRASLRARRYLDATKLALRTGGEAAGDSRHLELIQKNTDIAGLLLDPGTVQDLVSRRGFKGAWLGARHTYEAGLLAQNPELVADARSRIRLARDWLRSHLRLPDDERRGQALTLDEIAQLAFAVLRVAGPAACVGEVSRWRNEGPYRVMRWIAARLVDAGEFALLSEIEIAVAQAGALLPGLALIDELARVARPPSAELVRVILRRAPRRRKLGTQANLGGRDEAFGVYSMTNLIAAAAYHRAGRRDALLARLTAQLPTEPPRAWAGFWSGERFSLLGAYALRDALSGRTSTLADLAEPAVAKELAEEGSSYRSEDARRFLGRVAPVWPFARLLAKWRLTPPTTPIETRQELVAALKGVGRLDDARRDERASVEGDIATHWLRLLALAPPDVDARTSFLGWLDRPDQRVFVWPELARIAARTPHLQDLAYGFCQRGLRNEHDSTEDVSSKIETYVAVSRAILALDRNEAAAYFERAIEVASRIGDEAYDRWDSILQLGDRASEARPQSAELAYRFGRCGEVLRGYLDRHFDWTATLRILGRISPEGGLAAVSRWRDRGVGWFKEMLPEVLQPIVEDGVIDAREAAAFIGFDFPWAHEALLEPALAGAHSDSERARIAANFLRYLRLAAPGAKKWCQLEVIASRHSLPTNLFTDHRKAAEAAEARQVAKGEVSRRLTPSEPLAPDRWDAVFETDDIEGPEGLAAVLGRNSLVVLWGEEKAAFWAQVFQRLKPGREAAFVRMALQHPSLKPFEIDEFLKAVPPAWRARLATREALKVGLQHLLAKHHASVWHNRLYQRFSLPAVADAAGEPVSWALEHLFDAYGADTLPLEAGQSFQLVSLLAMHLAPADALEGFSFGLTLIEAVLQPEDGDGPWVEALRPDGDPHAALASLLWGCLAAPEAAMRWQAAHTVRGLCLLESSLVLDRLIALSAGARLGPFADSRFVFYQQHARLWLLIAMARAALDDPATVAQHGGYLVQEALGADPHVLMRHFSKAAAIALSSGGFLQLDAETLGRLQRVNCSPYPVVASDRYKSNRSAPPARDWGSKRFHFAYDMDRYWAEPLGVVFDKAASEVEELAEGVVCDDWGVTSPSGWQQDARRTAAVLGDDYTSHGGVPRVDNLDFYLSFHALMTVAGKLLATSTAQADMDGGPRFEAWIARHLLTRGDGRWLADRRDPAPPEVGQRWRSVPEADWRWQVTAEEFTEAFDLGDGRLAVWGHWTSGWDRSEHSTYVASALVSRQHSAALLRALQTIDNPRDFGLPDAGDDLELNEPDFELMGWIEAGHRHSEFDEYDPWAGDISYPPRRPATFVRAAMGLSSDVEERIWTDGLLVAMRTEIWGSGRDRDGYAMDEGDRVLVDKDWLTRLLTRLDRDLIVEVQIEHRLRRAHSRLSDDDLEFAAPYSKLFLVRCDGSVISV